MQEYKRRGDLYGKMKHHISFISETGSKNNPNDSSIVRATVWTCHAMVGRDTSNEMALSERQTLLNTVMFTTRYESTIDNPKLLINYKSDDYDIEGIENVELDDAFLKFTAVKRV